MEMDFNNLLFFLSVHAQSAKVSITELLISHFKIAIVTNFIIH